MLPVKADLAICSLVNSARVYMVSYKLDFSSCIITIFILLCHDLVSV